MQTYKSFQIDFRIIFNTLIIILVIISCFHLISFERNYLELTGVKLIKERSTSVCFLCRVYLKIKLKTLNKLDLKMSFLIYIGCRWQSFSYIICIAFEFLPGTPPYRPLQPIHRFECTRTLRCKKYIKFFYFNTVYLIETNIFKTIA